MAQEMLESIKSRQVQLRAGGRPKKRSKMSSQQWPAEHDVTVAAACTMLPPGAKLWSDDFCNRFQAFYDKASCSRSWMKHGYQQSLKLCVQWCWTTHTAATGEECTVANLFG